MSKFGMASIEASVSKIFDLYELKGNSEYAGEPVSQLEHAWQSFQFAEAEGLDEDVRLAAFFHDIGHLCGEETVETAGFGVKSHEKIGADFLRAAGFSEKIARLVEGHVQAKRYLTFARPDYYERLSDASKKTLEWQGGVMTPFEAMQFEEDPMFELYIKMRHWDEAAKVPGVPGGSLNLLKTMAKNHLLKSEQ